jgi:hypothetical protein
MGPFRLMISHSAEIAIAAAQAPFRIGIAIHPHQVQAMDLKSFSAFCYSFHLHISS